MTRRQNIAESFARDGYVFPLPAMSAGEAAGFRADLEAIERDHAGHPILQAAVYPTPHLLFPFVDEIMRRPAVLRPVAEILREAWGDCQRVVSELAARLPPNGQP